MAAPPPPPPPPPPSNQSNFAKPDNKNLLASICKGTSLKKVPNSAKNDRSDALVSTNPKVSNSGSNNSGPLIPRSNSPMSIAEALAARKLAKETAASTSLSQTLSATVPNAKRIGIPPPNTVPTMCIPPPPSQSKKPVNMNDMKPVPPPPNFPGNMKPDLPPNLPQPPGQFKKPPQEMKVSSSNYPPPPPPFQGSSVSIPPPPMKDMKPRFRPPLPLCNKPTTVEERFQPRGPEINQPRGSMIPPPLPPLGSFNDVRPPRFDPPPPPPNKVPPQIPTIHTDKPSLPVRIDSNVGFDSRFSFADIKYFPEPSSVSKIRQN